MRSLRNNPGAQPAAVNINSSKKKKKKGQEKHIPGWGGAKGLNRGQTGWTELSRLSKLKTDQHPAESGAGDVGQEDVITRTYKATGCGGPLNFNQVYPSPHSELSLLSFFKLGITTFYTLKHLLLLIQLIPQLHYSRKQD